MFFAFTVDDIGLEGYSTPEHLLNIINLANELEIKATFFTVPRTESGLTIDRQTEYIAILKDALAAGHEVAQHGIEHNRFEIGIPPEMVLNLPHEGPSREFLRTHREWLEIEHQMENIRRKLKTGRMILENAFETAIMGFRAPALQSCENMFLALAKEGYAYDSSIAIQETGWDLLNDTYDTPPRPITRQRFDAMQKTGLIEFPLTTDYTWYLPPERYQLAMKLARHDFIEALNTGIPLVPLCHVSPVQATGDYGFKFLREWINWIKQQTPIEALTLTRIAKLWK